MAPNTLGRQKLGLVWQTTQRGMERKNQEGIVRNNTLSKESLNVWDLCALTQLLAENVKLHEGVRIQRCIKWALLPVPSLASCVATDHSFLSECLQISLGSMRKKKSQRHVSSNILPADPMGTEK